MPGFTVGMLAAGAAAQRGEDRPRERPGGVAETQGDARPLQRDRRGDGRPTPTTTRSSPRWASCRTSSTTATPGTSTPSSSRPWTPCAARRRDADVTTCPVASAAASRCASCCWRQPDLLLLDEPTNHLDAESVQWLEQHLEKYPGTVVAVTHDRYFLDNVAQWILELDRGRAYPYEGNYSTYLETKAAAPKVEGQKDAKRKKRLEDELEWVRSNAKARQTKSQGASAALRGDGRRGRQAPQARLRGDPDPAGPPAGHHGDRGRGPHQGLRRPAC